MRLSVSDHLRNAWIDRGFVLAFAVLVLCFAVLVLMFVAIVTAP